MLIATKNYEGAARVCDLESYECAPANQEELRGDLITYEEKKIGEKQLQINSVQKKQSGNFINKIIRKLNSKEQ